MYSSFLQNLSVDHNLHLRLVCVTRKEVPKNWGYINIQTSSQVCKHTFPFFQSYYMLSKLLFCHVWKHLTK